VIVSALLHHDPPTIRWVQAITSSSQPSRLAPAALGKGWLNGGGAQLILFRSVSTDFILAVFGEEFTVYARHFYWLLVVSHHRMERGVMRERAHHVYQRLKRQQSMVFSPYAFVNIGMSPRR
jgi:cell division protein FtsW (lipid II flippase)